MIQRIDTFLGQYRFLSNFSPSEIRDTDGFVYRTAEHAYQAGKTEYVGKRAVIAAALTPGHAKRLGLQLDLRADWSEKRHLVMLGVLRAKFTDPWLMSQLCGTDPAELVEGNNWHDQFWGDCGCGRNSCLVPGQNWLGQHLMTVRAELLVRTKL